MKKTIILLLIILSSQFVSAQKIGDLYQYSGVVNHVRDGDTFECLVSVGFDVYINVVVRMASMDAPEMKGKDSIAARRSAAYLSRRINGKKIYFTSKQYDKYKRSIAYIFLSPKDTISLNEEMIRKGYAIRVRY